MPASLVTGGAGFIGRSLVGALLARGERVRVLDPVRTDDLPPGAEQIQGSILDRAAVAAALEGIDHLYHLAGIAHLWTPDKADLARINHQGTREVMRAARESRVARILHCSTEAILMPPAAQARAVDETVELGLSDMPGPYTRSKYLAEQAARAAAGEGLAVVVVNPTVPIGPGDRNMTAPAAMLALFLQGGPPAFLDCVLNLVDVRDVGEGMVLALERGRAGERYILGGENVRLGELLARLEAMTGRAMPKRRIPGTVALAFAALAEAWSDRVSRRPPTATVEGVRLALRSTPLDGGKARRELGYAPRPVDGALAETVAWLTAQESGKPGKVR